MRILDKVPLRRSLEDTVPIEHRVSCVIETKQPDGSVIVEKKKLEASVPEEE